LGGALAVLFPIDWPEPFGLVMIEAMACGTPVIAFNRGSVAEVIEHGVTGFIVGSVEEAAEAAKQAATLDRERIRATFERRFTAETMAMGYEAAYRAVLEMAQGIPLPSRRRPYSRRRRRRRPWTPRRRLSLPLPVSANCT
jgi:glycosyltransferase involved in cell wall biosynthesis